MLEINIKKYQKSTAQTVQIIALIIKTLLTKLNIDSSAVCNGNSCYYFVK